jgi:hypothetical protein
MTEVQKGRERTPRFSTRDAVYIAVLAAMWAVSESVLGGQLHALNIPFSGVVLAAIAVFLMITCRSLVPKIGSILIMGIVVALLRILSIGGVILSPTIAIIMEALLIELAMTLSRRVTALSSSIGGMLVLLWTFVHPFVVQPLLFGLPMLTIYKRTIVSGSQILGIDPANIIVILGALLIIHGIVGIVAGMVGWRFSTKVLETLKR